MSVTVRERLERVRAQIEDQCARVGRDRNDVRLVAVSKMQPVEAIREAYAAGQRDFAENYVQELVAKAEQLRDLEGLRWHLVGHLQRNKVKEVVRLEACVQSLDSERLAQALGRAAVQRGSELGAFLQVNIAREPQKHGCDLDRAEWLAQRCAEVDGLHLRGLMVIAPQGSLEGERDVFVHARRLRERLDLKELSMGMSQDFLVAIEEGATVLRLGTAVFGPRPI